MKRKMKFAIFGSLMALVTLLGINGCASVKSLPSIPSISYINSHRSEFDGKDIVLRGYMVLGPESTYVTDKKGYTEDYWRQDTGCLSIVNSGDLNSAGHSLNGKLVIVSGVYKGSIYSYGVSLRQCSTSGIDIGANWREAIKVIKQSD